MKKEEGLWAKGADVKAMNIKTVCKRFEMTNTQRGEETGGNCILGKWSQTSGVGGKKTHGLGKWSGKERV